MATGAEFISVDGVELADFGGEGPIVLFSHANGYPPHVYTQLLSTLSKSFRVLGIEHRPLRGGNPNDFLSWDVMSQDIVKVIDFLNEPAFAFGHSMGGSALMMATKHRPDCFRAMALVEPVLLSKVAQFALNTVAKWFPSRVPPIRRALNRTDNWDSRGLAFDHFRPKRVFKNFSDAALWDYVENGTYIRDGRAHLRFSKEWEARCYALVQNVWPLLGELRMPVVGFKGANSNTLPASAWEKWKLKAPAHQFVEIEESGHLLPLEYPDLLAAHVAAFFASI